MRTTSPTYEALLPLNRLTTPSWFWNAGTDELDIEFFEPYYAGHGFPPPKGTCVAAVVRRRTPEHRPQLPGQMGKAPRPPTLPLIRWEGEEGATSDADLRENCSRPTNRCANALRDLGVTPGRPRRPLHADVPRADCGLLRGDQDWRASSCRCSPATASTLSPPDSGTRARGRCSPPTGSGGGANGSRCKPLPMQRWRPPPECEHVNCRDAA